jgi:exonuclease SbcC
MRPLRLEIQGLTSYRELQKVDFCGLELFVIVGPTGAGKSTVLDAIALALYGEVPRTGKKNAAELVNHGETRAKALFEFQADGKTYRIARQLPRSGAQKAALERLNGGDWITEVEESGVKAVNARIEEIIGLDFEAFTRAVLLPQGDFAKFLGGDPKQRRDILVRLLDLGRYEKAGQLARGRAENLTHEVSSNELLIENEYAEATEDRLAAATEEAAQAERRASDLKQGCIAVETAAETLAAVERHLVKIDENAADLGKVAQVLVSLSLNWQELETKLAKQQEALQKASADLDAAESSRREAVAKLEKTLARTGNEHHLAILQAACAVAAQEHKTIADLDQTINSAQQELAEVKSALADATAYLDSARARDQLADAAEKSIEQDWTGIAERIQMARARANAEQAVAAAASKENQARAKFEKCREALRIAEADAAAAHEHLVCLRGEHAAIAIRTGLALGEPCPVCHHWSTEFHLVYLTSSLQSRSRKRLGKRLMTALAPLRF